MVMRRPLAGPRRDAREFPPGRLAIMAAPLRVLLSPEKRPQDHKRGTGWYALGSPFPSPDC
jgi:hypothetical protein